ncbi:MAG TPA: flagellar motor stator protein MotA [Gemmataceae bacterium]|nr:flagellar motor stator protein MotA [Gemmataceae bacterium]
MVYVGAGVVLLAVLCGFSMAGGHVGALLHPSEFVTIGGASLGALLIMSPKKVLADVLRGVLQVLKGSPFNKAMYTELFKVLYQLSRLVRREGMIALEGHVENPAESKIFQTCPKILANASVKQFLCSGLMSIIDNKAEPGKLTHAFEEEIKVLERENHAAVGALVKTADGLPGFGIVAAVLGIVVTMQSIGGPVDEIGHKVGAALVGTFLGILLSYGLFAPLAARLEALGEAQARFFHTLSTGLVALSEGENPKAVVERARRGVGSDCRSTQVELEQMLREAEAA